MNRMACWALLIPISLFGAPSSHVGTEPARQETQESVAPDSSAQQTSVAVPCGPGWWIGVCCEPVPAVALTQLGLEHGLAVVKLADAGPAQKAGVELHDIIVEVDGRPLRDTDQLNSCIRSAEGAEMELRVLRRGTQTTVRIVPEKRPPCETVQPLVIMLDSADGLSDEQIRIIQDFVNEHPDGSSIQLVFVRPGVVLQSMSDVSQQDADDKEGPCCPSNVEMHLKYGQIDAESVLLGTADLKDNNVVTGCLVRLARVIEDQIVARERDLESLRLQLSTQVKQDTRDPRIPTSPEAANQIKLLESQLEILEDTRNRLRQLGTLPYSDENGEDPCDDGQSTVRPEGPRLWS